jgi:hypothetical protein
METVVDIRADLTDIRAWKSCLSDTVDTILGISSPRMSFGGGGGVSAGLTGKVAATIDDDSAGAYGIRTEAGLLDLLGSWARSFAADRDETVGDPIEYLLRPGILEWAAQTADWSSFADEVTSVRTKLAKITGHAPELMARCPSCKGDVLREPIEDGWTTWGVCADCHAYYRDMDAIMHAAIAEARSVAVNPEATVTTKEALTIWPALKRDDIKNWIRAGKLSTPINLRDLNQLANALTEKRARTGWRTKLDKKLITA